MISVNQLTGKLREYIMSQVDSMAKTNPMISFIKPLVSRAVDKNFSKVKKVLDLIADAEGNVDIENILNEMIDSLIKTDPFTFKTSFAGDIEIGEGLIKMNVPLTNKRLVFNQEDLQSFRDCIIN